MLASSSLPEANGSSVLPYNNTNSRDVDEGTALLENAFPSLGSSATLFDQESWNEPKVNIYRFASTNYSFLIMGMNDASIGALIPHIETYYDIGYIEVSTLFVVPFFGYVAAALTNGWVHHAVGQRGVAFIGPICRLMAFVPIAFHPPFAAIPVLLVFTGFGNGIEDSAWNAWVGNMRNANEMLGLLHGTFGVGGAIGPLIASTMITKLNLEWYRFYYIMIVMTSVELVVGVASFWTATGEAYRRKHRFDDGRQPTTTREILSSPIPWLVAMFLFGYVGAEVCLGGWIPTFMIEVRHAEGFVAGLTVTLFWTGLTLGRVILGFVTGRIGEKLAIVGYLGLCITFQLLYWLIPDLIASMISVIFLGFFLGPLFPASIVTLSKLLPADQHVAAIGLASAIGGGGAAIFPFMVGAIAEEQGVKVLQPFVMAILITITVMWAALPGGFKRGGLEKARVEGVTFLGGLQDLFRRSSTM